LLSVTVTEMTEVDDDGGDGGIVTKVTVVETVRLRPSLLSVSVDVQADGGD
jgi:hypothetical protein